MIFLELVPSSMPKLLDEAQWAINACGDIHGINVPDILRVDHRSYDAVVPLVKSGIDAIPHIRICDFKVAELMDVCRRLIDANVSKVLLITGDPPPNPLQPIYHHYITEIIHQVTTHFPSLTVYAAYDPYRQRMIDEFEYAKEKIAAGAKGLFTQPIFDPHLVHSILNMGIDCEWYIGISPVLTEPSYNYWVTRNNVVFNHQFTPAFDANVALAKDILSICKSYNQHNYIMPIKAPLKPYISAVFND